MDMNFQIQSDWTVEKILVQSPQTLPVFIRNHMHCAGCYMQRFCKIKEVADIYNVDLNTFLQDLNNPKIKTA